MQFDYKSGEIEWNYAQKTDEFELPSIEESVAFHFALVLGSGELDRLRKCEMSDCRKYFIGTDRAMWCSNTCGSRNRARNKRKRDSMAITLVGRAGRPTPSLLDPIDRKSCLAAGRRRCQ